MLTFLPFLQIIHYLNNLHPTLSCPQTQNIYIFMPCIVICLAGRLQTGLMMGRQVSVYLVGGQASILWQRYLQDLDAYN